jgi:hypothetical protein
MCGASETNEDKKSFQLNNSTIFMYFPFTFMF